MSSDSDRVIADLAVTDPLREPVMRAAIEALCLPEGSRGLDIGCGIGRQALLLAEAIGPAGRVAGLDLSWASLEYACKECSRSPTVDRITFAQGDMHNLPFAHNLFDWAWSVDCVGYPVGDLLPLLRGICRVVRPGGLVALLGWTSQQVLPGHEMLEARLNAHCSSYAPFLSKHPPRRHFQRGLISFHQAGMVGTTCSTLVGQVQAPLCPEVREAMALLFDMLWAGQMAQASEADAQEYRRLCSPSSPDFLPDEAGYCGFFTYMMFSGRVPGAG